MTDAETGHLEGHFYLDLFPREGKYGHQVSLVVLKLNVAPLVAGESGWPVATFLPRTIFFFFFFFCFYSPASLTGACQCVIPIRPGCMRNGERQTPAVALIGNNPKPTATKPSLLTHSQVSTLFHEFGHVMHGVLTRSKYAMFSWAWSAVPYTGGVELDMLEAPSMMLENWPWEAQIIKRLSKHHETGKCVAMVGELRWRAIHA